MFFWEIPLKTDNKYCVISLSSLGLSPTDSFDEAIADMITDAVKDVFQDAVKFFRENDEVKKVLHYCHVIVLSFSSSIFFLSSVFMNVKFCCRRN